MTSSGSPCGACKFLRRKCVRGCVFAPYFCHEQGAAHFAAIHKVFGASNISKLLSNLPVGDRCEAAVTISYEAQARLQDPIYGCVSHIFALQQQVFNLQAQLASLKEQAAQGLSAMRANTGAERIPTAQQLLDMQSWSQLSNSSSLPQFGFNDISNATNYHGSFSMDSSSNSMGDYKNNVSLLREDNSSFGSFEDASHRSSDVQAGNGQWSFQDATDEFESVAFDYARQW
ncbi:LOB domain-containing protein 29-like [Punica granatum]|uniref:LOB domain-containing protein n=2 Tax=Punica granatum TaxID=22663 RepID=A0A218X968_PUNGR|nr:LOB domain-containing protein 29-like [Punica granatum]OWM81483.1 hypothetical protein CDL15_Pgr007521 [Punica granatum]PKI60049.1 hypothetical protein CRG98_019534 [Punica granatum]